MITEGKVTYIRVTSKFCRSVSKDQCSKISQSRGEALQIIQDERFPTGCLHLEETHGHKHGHKHGPKGHKHGPKGHKHGKKHGKKGKHDHDDYDGIYYNENPSTEECTETSACVCRTGEGQFDNLFCGFSGIFGSFS